MLGIEKLKQSTVPALWELTIQLRRRSQQVDLEKNKYEVYDQS